MAAGRSRHLIVNADDFGLTDGVNRGIVEAHRHGIVTNASLMVRAPRAAQAVAEARSCPRLGLGLHVDIGEWLLHDGEWTARYELVAPGDLEGALAEIEAQVSLFVELTGFLPDHIDSHQHVHMKRPEMAEGVARVAGRLGVGVRGTERVAYRSLYGQDRTGTTTPAAIDPDAYVDAIRDLEPGITELACHPGYADGLESDYRTEREIELRSLCEPRVGAAIADGDVRLITWRDVNLIEVA